ncbi:MAG TPA: hypothetical protein VMQ17_17840 [Candidatus Sulfotelmatobacter sp.]|jgi:hypothetical protein|nr:hypothetical protein [Candidatus Sulfotelmatobacter sp.]
MKAVWLYRTASIIFVLFAAGHTYGFLSFRPASAEGRAVWEAMNNVRFEQGGDSFTYGGFYLGFGLSATVFLLFSAFLTWYVGKLATDNPKAIGPLGWALFVLPFVSIGLNWKYFSVVPAIFAAVLAAILGSAAWLVGAART